MVTQYGLPQQDTSTQYGLPQATPSSKNQNVNMSGTQFPTPNLSTLKDIGSKIYNFFSSAADVLAKKEVDIYNNKIKPISGFLSSNPTDNITAAKNFINTIKDQASNTNKSLNDPTLTPEEKFANMSNLVMGFTEGGAENLKGLGEDVLSEIEAKSGIKIPPTSESLITPRETMAPSEPIQGSLSQSKNPMDQNAYSNNTQSNIYVKNEPLNFELGKNDNTAAQSIRDNYVGVRDAQIIRGSQLADDITKIVPNKIEQDAMTFITESSGDKSLIEKALLDPKYEEYKPALERALNPTPQMVEALQKGSQFYKEAGDVSKELGTIKQLRENYTNRIYKKSENIPTDYVNAMNINKGIPESNLKMETGHGEQRSYNTIFDAINDGKKPATLNYSDLLNRYNADMANVNTNIKLTDAMSTIGLHDWIPKENSVPEGFTKTGLPDRNIEGKDFTSISPKGIAKGLKPIIEPNFGNKIDALKGIDKYQALVKTWNLSYSFFHHMSLSLQMIYQGGLRDFLSSGMMFKTMDTQAFKDMEVDFARYTGRTTKNFDNMDILHNLTGEEPSKLSQAPVIKQLIGISNKNSEFLFNGLQRYNKVSNYGSKISAWIGDHPNATNSEVEAAKRGIAKEINAAFGTLNWESLGWTKTELTWMKRLLLAPDWTMSNITFGKYVFTAGQAGSEARIAGNAARANIARAIIYGGIATEGLNYLLTGHSTASNAKGHKFDIQLGPGVYTSLFKGGIGEMLKLGSKLATSGIAGLASYAEGKGAPLIRTAIGVGSGVNYYGQKITNKKGPLGKSLDYAKYSAIEGGPIPFGLSSALKYVSDKKKTIAGELGVATGVATYTPPGGKKNTSNINMYGLK